MSTFEPVDFIDTNDNIESKELENKKIKKDGCVYIENEEIIKPIEDFDLQNPIIFPYENTNSMYSLFTYNKIYKSYQYEPLEDFDETKQLFENKIMHNYDTKYSKYTSLYMSHLDQLELMIKELDEMANKKNI